MLTGGIPPKDLTGKSDKYVAALHEDAIPIRNHVPLIPAALAEVIDKALKEKPLKDRKDTQKKRPVYGFNKVFVFKNEIKKAISR
jgi:hypothetical protein